MKELETRGITYIEQIPGGDGTWYCGLDFAQGDLYEAEELFKEGRTVKGRNFCLIRYPEGEVFFPLEKREGFYPAEAVQEGGTIYIPEVDFPGKTIRIYAFDCATHETEIKAALPLSAARDCYNLRLHVRPLTLTRQGGADGLFEIIWPEKASFPLDPHESFFLRDDNKLYFNRWDEEGEGEDYVYREETVVRDLAGALIEVLPGDVRLMPDGELWHLK